MELKTYFAQDRNGSLIPLANVAVYLTGTTTLATGLKKVDGSTLANPFTADADGKIQFYAPDGIYDMQVTLGSVSGVKVTFQCLDLNQQVSDAKDAADRAEQAAAQSDRKTFQIVNEYELTGLTANTGDMAVVSSVAKTFRLAATPATSMENWIEIKTDALMQLAKPYGFSLVGKCQDVATLKTMIPSAIGVEVIVDGYNSDTPGVGGGRFTAKAKGTLVPDDWVIFASGNPEKVWVRSGGEQDRTILNCGAKPNSDITAFLTLAATNGLTIYADNTFDVKTTGGIVIESDLSIVGIIRNPGYIVLNSTQYDEIFQPGHNNDCSFYAEGVNFKAATVITNTPYVVGSPMSGYLSTMRSCEVNRVKLLDIGISFDMKYHYDVDVSVNRLLININKSMMDSIIATGRATIRAPFRTGSWSDNNTAVETWDSQRNGHSSIQNVTVVAYMPAASNQDIAKFTGMFSNQKIGFNHFHNTNPNSFAEVDCYAGVDSSAYIGNTHKNVSTKFMSLANNGTSEYLCVRGLTATANTWLFEQGAVNNYGVYFKPDISCFGMNTIRNNQQSPTGDFHAIWIESSRGANGYMGSQAPVGLSIVGNVIDIECPTYNGHSWMPFETISVPVLSAMEANIFKGGALPGLIGGQNIGGSNQFINVEMPLGSELRTRSTGNSRGTISSGVVTNASEITATATKNGSNINTVAVTAPWLANETGKWTLLVVSSSAAANNRQAFEVIANPGSQTVVQVAGRYATSITDDNLKNVFFNLVITGSGMTLTSIGGTTDVVTVKYKWAMSL